MKTPVTVKDGIAYLESRIEKDTVSGCWLWTGSMFGDGYGRIRGRIPTALGWSITSHKASYQAYKGNIPVGLVVRHRCNQKRCCNPDHLELGTQEINNLDKCESLPDRSLAALQNLKKVLEDMLQQVNDEMGRR